MLQKKKMTPTVRLELTTPGLEVRCAIQLRQLGGINGMTFKFPFKTPSNAY